MADDREIAEEARDSDQLKRSQLETEINQIRRPFGQRALLWMGGIAAILLIVGEVLWGG